MRPSCIVIFLKVRTAGDQTIGFEEGRKTYSLYVLQATRLLVSRKEEKRIPDALQCDRPNLPTDAIDVVVRLFRFIPREELVSQPISKMSFSGFVSMQFCRLVRKRVP